MNHTIVGFFLTWLFWWVVLSVTYTGLILAIDALVTSWQRRQRAQRALRRQLAQIDSEANDAVRRIGSAFAVAQQLIREQNGAAGSRWQS